MKLADWEIRHLIEATDLVSPAKPQNIQANSLDVFLGETIQVESEKGFDRVTLDKPFYLFPNCFCLGHTLEIFHLPNDISAEYRLTSGLARQGLAHSIATEIKPGYHGRLTLELKNYLQFSNIKLYRGMKIGQVIFYRQNPCLNPYNGRYNGDLTVSLCKP